MGTHLWSLKSNLQSFFRMPPAFERLPKGVIPQHYNLSLTPNIENFTFTGEVSIAVSIQTKTDTIRLNGVELKILSASYENVDAKSINYDEKNEAIEFQFSDLPVSTG